MSMWNQFRRLLLGTVVEGLLAEQVQIDFSSLRIDFDKDSDFRVPRLNNYMRFKGALKARLLSVPTPQAEAGLEARLLQAWPELLAVVDIPIGDRLTSDRNHIDVVFERSDPPGLRVDFDLVAD